MSSILNDKQIRSRIERDRLIENLDIDHCLSPASYEMRIGSFREAGTLIDLSPGEVVAIVPNGFLLVGTVERVHLPLDLVAMMYLRSTYARMGFLSWFQGIVDPGFRGALTVVLHNLTSNLIPITGHDRICHLVFHQLSERADRPYGGTYYNSPGAQGPESRRTVRVAGQTLAGPTDDGRNSGLREELAVGFQASRGLRTPG